MTGINGSWEVCGCEWDEHGVSVFICRDCQQRAEVERHTDQGLRYNTGKPRVDLLDPMALEGTAVVLTYGATKYAERNWEKGMAWSKVIASLLRHVFLFMKGEDIDKESGLPHVDHIGTNAMFLQRYYRTHKDKDDRAK